MVGRTIQLRATRCMLAWLLSAERKERVSIRDEVSIVCFPSSARRRRRSGWSMLVMREDSWGSEGEDRRRRSEERSALAGRDWEEEWEREGIKREGMQDGRREVIWVSAR